MAENMPHEVIEQNGQPTVPLDEFCRDISRGDRRLELISAFQHMERAAGREHDTEANYRARFGVAHLVPA